MPGEIARERSHRQADAINVMGWIGLITLGLAWPIAPFWTYTKPNSQGTDDLGDRVATLEAWARLWEPLSQKI